MSANAQPTSSLRMAGGSNVLCPLKTLIDVMTGSGCSASPMLRPSLKNAISAIVKIKFVNRLTLKGVSEHCLSGLGTTLQAWNYEGGCKPRKGVAAYPTTEIDNDG